MRKGWILFAVLFVLGVISWYFVGPRHTPPGQPPLVSLSKNNTSGLQAAFNDAADRPRLLLLLSPT